MPLYMDRHEVGPGESFTAEDVIRAHELDLERQDEYGVKYLSALVDVDRQRIFCLAEGPSREACEAVHQVTHGMMASRIIEVDQDIVDAFFGNQMTVVTSSDLVFAGTLHTILMTDMAGSTQLYERLGDTEAVRVRREHDALITSAITTTGGRMIKQTGDGILASFNSVVRGAHCALQIQAAITERATSEDWPIRVRIGMSAGEPVAEGRDLFGGAVNLAARICGAAEPGAILASRTLRELAMGKDLHWEDAGAHELRGFEEPVHLFTLVQ
jgi:class 3 adenylate cyclase